MNLAIKKPHPGSPECRCIVIESWLHALPLAKPFGVQIVVCDKTRSRKETLAVQKQYCFRISYTFYTVAETSSSILNKSFLWPILIQNNSSFGSHRRAGTYPFASALNHPASYHPQGPANHISAPNPTASLP